MSALEAITGLFRQTWANLARHKLRSFLTMFGIAWGMIALTLMNALGDGFQRGGRNYFKQIGDNLVLVFGGRTERISAGQTAGRRIRLYERDLEAIRHQCPDVRLVSGEIKRYQTSAASEFNSGRYLALGVTPEYLVMRYLPLENGRHINAGDHQQARRVCVLGAKVSQQLFGERPAVVGRQVRINGLAYQVVGVMTDKRQSSTYDGFDNEKIVIPASSFRRDCPPSAGVAGEGLLNAILYQPSSPADWRTPQRQVRQALARVHNFDPEDEKALQAVDYVRIAEAFESIFISAERFLAFVAFITLSLGGVGVMNTMMMAVSERTNEIGLKKALGATRRRILLDFFLEGLALALASGLAGFTLVSLLAAAVNTLPVQGMFGGLPVQGATVLLAFLCLGTVAVAAAIPPAWRASRLPPAEALRFER